MNAAFIPVRGGSKSIPLKNIRPMCHRPLVYWTIKAACECGAIDTVYVATDSPEIRAAIEAFRGERENFSKIRVIDRSAESATDTASTEFAMLEFAANYEFDNIVLIQATSPLLEAGDLDRGFEEFAREDIDSVMSFVKQKRFNWRYKEDGNVEPTNYDVFKRPRRQEFDGYLVENGAFYITSKADLLETKSRVSGRIGAVEMDEDTFFEIDEPSDWLIIEALMNKKFKSRTVDTSKIKMFLTDCDGCLTDAGMYYSEKGDELKKFNTKDGLGIKELQKKGVKVGIVTGESVELNQRRADKLGLDIFRRGCKDKAAVIRELCKEYSITPENMMYMGDDLNDMPAIDLINEYGGLTACPADAAEKVRNSVKKVCTRKGGDAAVRELIDSVL